MTTTQETPTLFSSPVVCKSTYTCRLQKK